MRPRAAALPGRGMWRDLVGEDACGAGSGLCGGWLGSQRGSADAGGGPRRVGWTLSSRRGSASSRRRRFAPLLRAENGRAGAAGLRRGAGSGEAAAGRGCTRVTDPGQRGAARPPLAMRRAVTGGPGPGPGVPALRRGLPAGRTGESLGACGAWQTRGEIAPGCPCLPRRDARTAARPERVPPSASARRLRSLFFISPRGFA